MFFECLSLSPACKDMPTLIFSIGQSKAQGVSFCTINLFLYPLVYILSSVLATVALDVSVRRPLLLPHLIHNSIGLVLIIIAILLTWTPETELVLMRASLPARIGQEKLHKSQTPQPRADHPQVADRGATA
jgi:hypothetical protein